MTHGEMTISEILEDPLIRQMMQADRVPLKEMRRLLHQAAHAQRIERRTRPVPRAVTPAKALSKAAA